MIAILPNMAKKSKPDESTDEKTAGEPTRRPVQLSIQWHAILKKMAGKAVKMGPMVEEMIRVEAEKRGIKCPPKEE